MTKTEPGDHRPRSGWSSLAGRIWHRSVHDRLTTAASSVAFYLLLGSIPGLAAIVSVYSLFADPGDVVRLTQALGGVVPPEVAQLLTQQIGRLADQQDASGRSLLPAAGWLAFVLWSANRGMRGMVEALNVIYDHAERRPLIVRLMLTMAMTMGVVAFLALAIFAVILLPLFLQIPAVSGEFGPLPDLLRWAAMLLVAGVAIALLLRFGPNRRRVHWPSLLGGSIAGGLSWILLSIVFSWYARTYGGFSAVYGSLGSVAAFMIWLWLSAVAVLLGAELDAALTAARSGDRADGQNAEDKEDREDDESDHEQPFGDGPRAGGDVRKAENAGDD